MTDPTIALYALPLAVILTAYFHGRRSLARRNVSILGASVASSLMEPPSLHPKINESLCIGCQACVMACPEEDVLGLVGAKVQLINPSHCIGHGACKAACPTRSIELVFGTEKRGVDIPLVNQEFQTDVPGVFIAGELGGMGLIKNAVTQGRQAMESVSRLPNLGQRNILDVAIVGAGPAGIAATLTAQKFGLRYATFEQETLGGAVAHYPRGKIVMTRPIELPLYGNVKLSETTKESLLELFRDVEQKTGIQVSYSERVESITPTTHGFEMQTNKGRYQSAAVLLAIGRRGTPRKLEVPGENQSKVVYRLTDAEQYRGQHVLVVGGGDSALEAAVALSEEPDTSVTLSYRGNAFNRAKEANRQRVNAAAKSEKFQILLESNVQSIDAREVVLDHISGIVRIPNDAVIVCAGGVLPTAFLKSIGITVETKHGTA